MTITREQIVSILAKSGMDERGLALQDRASSEILALIEKQNTRIAELETRYVGSRQECGHLKRFTGGQGTFLEWCAICENDQLKLAAQARITELERAIQEIKKVLGNYRAGSGKRLGIVHDIVDRVNPPAPVA